MVGRTVRWLYMKNLVPHQMLVRGATTLVLDMLPCSLCEPPSDQLARAAMNRWVVNFINRTAGGSWMLAGINMAVELTVARQQLP